MLNYEIAKKICKEHGVKGFRKMKLVRPIYTVGKQCSFLNQHIAERLISRLVEEGFEVAQHKTCLDLASKGLLDTILIS